MQPFPHLIDPEGASLLSDGQGTAAENNVAVQSQQSSISGDDRDYGSKFPKRPGEICREF
jgi:hypothetical protein